MKRSRKIWFFVLIVLVIFQFIQPKKNHSASTGQDDISKAYAVPPELHETFTQKCYDCHSNHTRYPWYFHVQPIGWWLAAHIHDAKEHLNFSEFGTYAPEDASHKFDEILEVTRDRTMPIRGYVLLHPHSAITAEDEQKIHAWITTLRARTDQ